MFFFVIFCAVVSQTLLSLSRSGNGTNQPTNPDRPTDRPTNRPTDRCRFVSFLFFHVLWHETKPIVIISVPPQSEVVSPQRNGVHHHQSHKRAVATDVRSAEGCSRGRENQTDPRPLDRWSQSPRCIFVCLVFAAAALAAAAVVLSCSFVMSLQRYCSVLSCRNSHGRTLEKGVFWSYVSNPGTYIACVIHVRAPILRVGRLTSSREHNPTARVVFERVCPVAEPVRSLTLVFSGARRLSLTGLSRPTAPRNSSLRFAGNHSPTIIAIS